MAIMEGWVPGDRLRLCNVSSKNAHVELTFCAEGEEPHGPFRSIVPSRQIRTVGLDDLAGAGTLSPGKPYAVVVVSDAPLVVRPSRSQERDARRPVVEAGAERLTA